MSPGSARRYIMGDTVDTKRCTKCGEEKPLEEFYSNGTGGRRSRCKGCYIARSQGYRMEYYQLPEVKERVRAYYQLPEVKERMRARATEYRNRPGVKEQRRVYNREYQQTPRGKFVLKNCGHKRRIRKKHAIANTDEPITGEQWDAILKHQKNKCPDCGKRFSKKNPATMDHIVPVSKVPIHSSDNIRAVCGSCNSRKRDRVVPDYIQSWVYANGGEVHQV